MDKKKEKDNWKKIVVILFLIFICIFSIFGILILFLKNEMPLTVVSSESMTPIYFPGDLLLVEQVDEGEIMPFDIIVFWPLTWGLNRTILPFVPIVHRVINITREANFPYYKGTWYRTKGDLFSIIDSIQKTTLYNDPFIPHFCVIGKVVGRIPLLGLPKLWLDQIGGNLLIYMILLILIVLLVYSFLPKKENENEEKIKNGKNKI
ncbi:MAG: hypothetical protein HWN67_19625 [Candidatus Helarchaeota archaeon]|nr:hypothetical protein [Candidatus Helarchaeota archaeon]